jgi:hypothetical protein
MRSLICALSIIALLALPVPAAADTITFESLTDLEGVTNQFAGLGLTFANATVLTSGIVNPFSLLNSCGGAPGSLNDIDFPAHSGCNVVLDDGGAMRIDFSAPITAFSGFFTYVSPLTLEAFDASDVLLGTATSLFAENFASSANAPNELLALSFSGIRSILITGDPFGGSFTLDDLDFTPQADTGPPVNPVPEPATLYLVGFGAAGLWAKSKRSRSSDRVHDRRDS